MGQKGTNIIIAPEKLVPAVTLARMTQSTAAECTNLGQKCADMLNSGMLEGMRMTKQKELCAAVQDGTNNMIAMINKLSDSAQSLYEKYISAETRAMIDKAVSDAAEQAKNAASNEALKKTDPVNTKL